MDAAPEDAPDPGWRDADNARGFDTLVEALDYFQTWACVTRARRVIYKQLRPEPGRRILDAGCGTGYDVAALAPRVAPGGLVCGLDSSARMLDIARGRLAGLEGVELRQGSAAAIPYPDAGFDACMSLRTLQYLEEPIDSIRELMRVTRPGGRIVVCEGGVSVLDLPSPELTDRIVGSGWNVRHGGLGNQLKRLFVEAGLRRVLVQAATSIDDRPGEYALRMFREAAPAAAERGDVTSEEAETWLAALEERLAKGTWFGLDVMFVVSGTVPAK